eukprot:CAMPEP_0119567852 /NCGR_PEP_ID=MMETSP1352-20130426/37210_1 /TAXON_ID=265584 /ORGANISM="Stauroneis constricta, Strain CCMP1120" /LENGTH=260 /DNA_ID=CAMNT_0007617161 /DNA_START=17 /DNA_END=799 /DNA_ORIENTATION=-
MTGVGGSYAYKQGCNSFSATCKTHCPKNSATCPPKNPEDPRRLQPNAWLLLRNPMTSIPSRFNFQYEKRSNVKHHTKQMPEAAWKKMRNERIDADLNLWARTITWWMRGSKVENELSTIPPPNIDNLYNVSLIIQYEKITSPIHGPLMLEAIAAELRGANIPVPIDLPAIDHADASEHIHPWSCYWAQIVLNPKSKTKRSSEGRYTPSYNTSHQAELIATMDSLVERFTELSPRSDIVPILKEYRTDMVHNIRLDEEDDV